MVVPLCKTANTPIHGFLLHERLKNLDLDICFISMKVVALKANGAFRCSLQVATLLVLPRHVGPKEEQL